MRVEIYFKDGTVIKDCMITSIAKTNECTNLVTTDFYGKTETYNYHEVVLVMMHD